MGAAERWQVTAGELVDFARTRFAWVSSTVANWTLALLLPRSMAGASPSGSRGGHRASEFAHFPAYASFLARFSGHSGRHPTAADAPPRHPHYDERVRHGRHGGHARGAWKNSASGAGPDLK